MPLHDDGMRLRFEMTQNKTFRIGNRTMNILLAGQFQRRPTSTDRLISDDHDNLVSINRHVSRSENLGGEQ